MDLLQAFKNEVFRPIAILAVPGAFAAVPWLMYAANRFEEISEFWKAEAGVALWISLTVILASGMLIENIGSRIEQRIEKLKRFDADRRRWDRYLALEIGDEFVGHRYLKTIVLRLKFELSFAPALLIGAGGLLLLNSKLGVLGVFGLIVFVVAIVLLVAWLLYEAYSSVVVAAKTRHIILRAVRARARLLDERSGKAGPV